MLTAKIHKYDRTVSWSYVIHGERRVVSIYGENRIIWSDALAVVHRTLLLTKPLRSGMRAYQKVDAAIFY